MPTERSVDDHSLVENQEVVEAVKEAMLDEHEAREHEEYGMNYLHHKNRVDSAEITPAEAIHDFRNAAEWFLTSASNSSRAGDSWDLAGRTRESRTAYERSAHTYIQAAHVYFQKLDDRSGGRGALEQAVGSFMKAGYSQTEIGRALDRVKEGRGAAP